MPKYIDARVTFSEVPDEISLCISITGCPYRCFSCHSPHLRENIGEPLDSNSLSSLIENNKGITCVCFMGGDGAPYEVNALAAYVRSTYPSLKIAWYSGSRKVSSSIDLCNFDYIKVGPYLEGFGGLDSPTTNQVMYRIENITYKFRKHED